MKLALEEIKKLLLHNPFTKRSTLKVSIGTSKAPNNKPKIYGLSS
jgi:hypothetical protein